MVKNLTVTTESLLRSIDELQQERDRYKTALLLIANRPFFIKGTKTEGSITQEIAQTALNMKQANNDRRLE